MLAYSISLFMNLSLYITLLSTEKHWLRLRASTGNYVIDTNWDRKEKESKIEGKRERSSPSRTCRNIFTNRIVSHERQGGCMKVSYSESEVSLEGIGSDRRDWFLRNLARRNGSYLVTSAPRLRLFVGRTIPDNMKLLQLHDSHYDVTDVRPWNDCERAIYE